MINNTQILLALRARALTLSVCTTGATSLSATATGYARAAGSFITDGFAVGHELAASGFTTAANNGAKVVTAVDALSITCTGTVVEAAGSRTLAVGFPALQAWENVSFASAAGRWYVEEDYVPGPAAQITVGPLGEIEADPMYVIKLYGIANTGTVALSSVADALLSLFAPRTALTLSTGDVVRVRTNPAPYRGQLQQADPGHAVIVVTIPCRIRTANIL